MAAEKKKLIEYFSGSEGEKVTPLSLYVQELGRRYVGVCAMCVCVGGWMCSSIYYHLHVTGK